MDFKPYIRSIPDYPKPGVEFYDISTLLANAEAWKSAIKTVGHVLRDCEPELILGIESRGFLLAAPLSIEMEVGFAMMRKPGKLPGPVVGEEYELEYGTDRLELQTDCIRPGMRVVVVDDVLATGGTLKTGISLARQAGADVVAAACIIELGFLNGREQIDCQLFTLANYA